MDTPVNIGRNATDRPKHSQVRRDRYNMTRLVLGLWRGFLREIAFYKKNQTKLQLIVPIDAQRWGTGSYVAREVKVQDVQAIWFPDTIGKLPSCQLSHSEIRDAIRTEFKAKKLFVKGSKDVEFAIDNAFRGLRALGSLKRLNECTSVTTSNGVRITVTTAHQPQYSSEKLQEVHAYRIRMCNVSEVPIRLLSRHWFFESGTGGPVIEASGEGVVGQKPFLRAGQCFEYYSGTSLTTPFGYMHGEFEFTNPEDNSRFKAKVDRTLLSGSSTSNTTDPDTK